TITSSNTVVTIATTAATLQVNTTYYGHVNSIINGSSSVWTSNVTTATLANIPATDVSTWTGVNYTSVTVNWLTGGNPSNVTKYIVELSTVSDFLTGQLKSSTTYNLSGTFINLIPDTTYYAQVKAVNHSEIETSYLTLG